MFNLKYIIAFILSVLPTIFSQCISFQTTLCPDFGTISANMDQATFESSVQGQINSIRTSLFNGSVATCNINTFTTDFDNSVRYIHTYACASIISQQTTCMGNKQICSSLCPVFVSSFQLLNCINTVQKENVSKACNAMAQQATTGCIDYSSAEMDTCGFSTTALKTTFCSQSSNYRCCSGSNNGGDVVTPTTTTSAISKPVATSNTSINASSSDVSEKKESGGKFYTNKFFLIGMGVLVIVIGLLGYFYYVGSVAEDEDLKNQADNFKSVESGMGYTSAKSYEDVDKNIPINPYGSTPDTNNYNNTTGGGDNGNNYNNNGYNNDYSNYNAGNEYGQQPTSQPQPLENPFDDSNQSNFETVTTTAAGVAIGAGVGAAVGAAAAVGVAKGMSNNDMNYQSQNLYATTTAADTTANYAAGLDGNYNNYGNDNDYSQYNNNSPYVGNNSSINEYENKNIYNTSYAQDFNNMNSMMDSSNMMGMNGTNNANEQVQNPFDSPKATAYHIPSDLLKEDDSMPIKASVNMIEIPTPPTNNTNNANAEDIQSANDDMPIKASVNMIEIPTPPTNNTNMTNANTAATEDDMPKPMQVKITEIAKPEPVQNNLTEMNLDTPTTPVVTDREVPEVTVTSTEENKTKVEEMTLPEPSHVKMTEIPQPQQTVFNSADVAEVATATANSDNNEEPKKSMVNIIDITPPSSEEIAKNENAGNTSMMDNGGENGGENGDVSELPEVKSYRVIHNYVPQIDDELRLDMGNDVDVIYEYDDGWAWAINKTTGEQGACPLLCLASLVEEKTGEREWENQMDVMKVPGRRDSMLSADMSRLSMNRLSQLKKL